MQTLDIDANHVVRHYDASRKDCPMSMSGGDWARWKEFKRRITETEGLTVTQYEELKGEINGLKQEIEEIKPKVYRYMDNNMPEWAKPTVQKLMNKGIISGVADNCLDLSYDLLRLLVTNDRAGLYD